MDDLVPLCDELLYEHAQLRERRAGRAQAKPARRLLLMLTPHVDDLLFELGLTTLCAAPKQPDRPDYLHGNDMLPPEEADEDEEDFISTETGDDEDEEESSSSERSEYSWLDDEAEEVDDEEAEAESRDSLAGGADMDQDEVDELVQDTAQLAPPVAANGAGALLVFTVYEAGYDAFEHAWGAARRDFEAGGRESVRDYLLLILWALGDCDNWAAFTPGLRAQGDARLDAWGGARIPHTLELRLADEGLALTLPGTETDIVWATR
jgi:hypothetical protein